MEQNKIVIKRKKKKSLNEQYQENLLEWIDFFRLNPHRLITDYYGLTLYDFQKIVLYEMDTHSAVIFVGSRGIAKSTLTLLFAIERATLYPHQQVVIVSPTREQSGRFIGKVREFMRDSPNLRAEIKELHLSAQNSSIEFQNGSKIFAVPYGENALGIRCHILIVDEFVRTEKDVVNRVFVPFLTSLRTPRYTQLTPAERAALPEEQNKQLYLSSIRGADEWSYKELESYLKYMSQDDMRYYVHIAPYEFGVKNKFINKSVIEQSFKSNTENLDMVMAEYLCRPERGSENNFFKYVSLLKCQDNIKALYAMSDEEYIYYKNDFTKWKFYQEKLPNEIRLLCIDIALIESAANDNTAMWVLRLIPDGGKYKKIAAYCESMHGANAIIQAKRFKQLFYEMQCDYAIIDTNGVGAGVYDVLTDSTYDDARGVTYPSWTVVNPEDVKMSNRAGQISNNSVPVVYSVKTPADLLYNMIINAKNIFDKQDISFLMDTDDAVEYLNAHYEFYNIENSEDRARILNPYAQTKVFINEAINLQQYISGGYIKLKEKSGRRKDRVMALIYGLWYATVLESQLNQQNDSIIDWVCWA